jgi:hypothetical protein
MRQLSRPALIAVFVALVPVAVRAAPQLIVTISEVPVGDQGAVAAGALEVSSDTDLIGATLSASDLTSAQGTIPAQAITFDPPVIDVTAGSMYTATISVQIPGAQPVGTYTGTITATDGAVQSAVALSVLVNNRPALVVPGPQTVTAGATLSFNVSATDPDREPVVLTTRFLPDGAEFVDHGNGIGTFTYRTEPEAAGLTVTLIFFAFNGADAGVPPQDAQEVSISVIAPTPTSIAQKIADVMALLSGFGVRRGIEHSLMVKLEQARNSIDRGNTTSACGQLGAFVNETRAQSGKALATGQAAQLIASVGELLTTLGCR